MRYYESPIRAAEESRTGRAASRMRYPVIYQGKKVLAQIIYSKGDYKLTFAGLPGTEVRWVPTHAIIDRIKDWRPM